MRKTVLLLILLGICTILVVAGVSIIKNNYDVLLIYVAFVVVVTGLLINFIMPLKQVQNKQDFLRKLIFFGTIFAISAISYWFIKAVSNELLGFMSFALIFIWSYGIYTWWEYQHKE